MKRFLALFLSILMLASLGSLACAETEKMEISILHFIPEGNTSAEAFAYRDAFERFRAAYPNVTLVEDAASDDIDQRVRILAAANELPDIYVTKADTLPAFIASGQAQPLNQYLDADPEWQSAFLPGVFDEHTIDGQIYGVPFRQAFNCMIMYNKDIFAQVGYETFPATYEALKDALGKIKALGITPIYLGNKDRWPGESVMFNTLVYRFTGKQWAFDLKNGVAAFTDEGFLQACRAIQEMYQAGYFNDDVNSVGVDYAKAQYLAGKAAMIFAGSWDINLCEADDPQGIIPKTGLAMWPDFGTEYDATYYMGNAVGWANALNAKVTDPAKLEACVALLRMLSDTQFATITVQNGGIPVSETGDIDETLLHPLVMAMQTDIVERMVPAPLFDTTLPSNVSDTLYVEFQELLIGIKTPEVYAQNVQAEMDAAAIE